MIPCICVWLQPHKPQSPIPAGVDVIRANLRHRPVINYPSLALANRLHSESYLIILPILPKNLTFTKS